MVREIVFDTETTGFNPQEGHKIVEIGAVELINHIPTGKYYHQYINPKRDVPEESFKVHGLSEEFLRSYPAFNEIADGFLEFIGDADLVAHNANFDMNFINYELQNIKKDQILNNVIDTLEIAKTLFPGARNNLDALCRRFGIDNSERTNHGALLDSELLAKVYLELIGGQEPSMELDNSFSKKEAYVASNTRKQYKEARNFNISEEELSKHNEFLEKKIKKALWLETASE